MNYLSLFSGVEGGGLALQWLLKPKLECVGYVEIDEYCQAVLAQRIEDGYLNPAPIFGDIKKFISEGYAEAYKGMVDVLSAGFPCQPWSKAGKKQGEKDSRNLWPETLRAIQIINPKYVFLENTATITASYGYFGTILQQLAESGFNAKWCMLDAWDVGGPFYGKRIFIVASPNSINGKEGMGLYTKYLKAIQPDPDKKVYREMWLQTIDSNAGKHNGMAYYVERGTAIGNGQVPSMVKAAWQILTSNKEKSHGEEQ